jgi:transcriptional regulator with XRE-family HTH domain
VKFSAAKLKALVEADRRLSKDIARKAGFSPGSLSHWTLGKRVPGADELAALAKVFHVPLELFYDEPPSVSASRKPRGLKSRRDAGMDRTLDKVIAEAGALLERARSLKATLQKLRSAPSSGKTVDQARAETIAIAKDFADELSRRSK